MKQCSNSHSKYKYLVVYLEEFQLFVGLWQNFLGFSKLLKSNLLKYFINSACKPHSSIRQTLIKHYLKKKTAKKKQESIRISLIQKIRAAGNTEYTC